MIGAPASPNALTPKDLTTLLTKDQKLSIAGLVKKIQSPAVSEKPATRADLQDYLLKTLGPLYAQNGQPIKELVTDVDQLMASLLPSQKDMSGNGYRYAIRKS